MRTASSRGRALVLALLAIIGLGGSGRSSIAAAAISVAQLERMTPVDFATEILPIFRSNCLACHNQTKAKAELVLETPHTILKGSENGPVVIPGQSERSLLLLVASHQAKPTMPPRENKVASLDLTSHELGLLKLWIDQGAHGEMGDGDRIAWQPLPSDYSPMNAVALSSDGQIAACNRANQVFIYHLPTGQLLTRLKDPQLQSASAGASRGLAHLDSVHALAFSPDGKTLASGGYREIKLWRRPQSSSNLQARGVTNQFTAAAVSPDGAWLAFADRDGHITLRELASANVIHGVDTLRARVFLLKFAPDNKQLLSASDDGVIQLWDVTDGSAIAEAKSESAVTALSWLEEGFVSGAADGSVRIWAVPCRGKQQLVSVACFKTGNGEVLSLHTLPHCRDELLVASVDGVMRRWDIQSGVLIGEMRHGAPILAIAVRPDGGAFAAVGMDNSVTLWNADSGRELARMKGDRAAQDYVAIKTRALLFATNEVAYCQAAVDAAEKERKAQTDRVRKATDALGTAEKGVAEKRKKLGDAGAAQAVAEKVVAELQAEVAKAKQSYEAAESAAESARVELTAWLRASSSHNSSDNSAQAGSGRTRECSPGEAFAEAAADELVAKAHAAGKAKSEFERYAAEKSVSQKQADEKLAAARKQAQEADTELKKASQFQSNAENELSLAITAAHKAGESSVDAQNAVPIAQAEAKRTELEWDAARQAAIRGEQPIRAAAFSPNNRILATVGDDGLVHTWSADTGEGFGELGASRQPVIDVAWLPDGTLLSLSADGSATGWELNPEWVLQGVLGTPESSTPLSDRVNVLAFSADGQVLAAGSGEPSRSGQIQLWNVAPARLSREFSTVHSDAVLGLEFSRNGQYLASSAADRFMKVIELSAGKVARFFEGHTHHVLGVAWKEDGRTLATAGADNVVKLWDFRTGERRKNVDGFEKEVSSVAAFDSDQFLVSSGDHQVRIINEKGETVRAFKGAKDFLYCAAATPDGKRVVAGGQDGILWVWDGRTGALTGQLR